VSLRFDSVFADGYESGDLSAWSGSSIGRADDSPPSSRSDRPPTMKLR
jgi:hypothetical protein